MEARGGGGRGRGRARSTPVGEDQQQVAARDDEVARRAPDLSDNEQLREMGISRGYNLPSGIEERVVQGVSQLGVTIASPSHGHEIDSSNRGRSRGRGRASTITSDAGRGHAQQLGEFRSGMSPPKSPPSEQRSPEASQSSPKFGVEDTNVQSPPKPEVESTPNLRASSLVNEQSSRGAKSDTVSQSSRPHIREIISRSGTKGTPFVAGTNYLRLRLNEGHPGVVEYHVSFSVEMESVKMRRKMLHSFESELGQTRSFNGMTLYLPHILPNDVTVLEGVHPGDPNTPVTIHVTFVKVQQIIDCVHFFNVLLRRVMIEMGFIEMKRCFYDLNMARVILQHKLEIWPGQNMSAEIQEDGLMVCVDYTSRVLSTDTVYQYYQFLKQSRDVNVRKKFNDFIVNKFVVTKYNNIIYKIDDVSWDKNPMCEFERRDGMVSFVDYYKLQHKLEIKDKTQPLLVSNIKPRKNDIRQEIRVALLVPEFCHITGLTDTQKADFNVMKELAVSTRLTPQQRAVNMRAFIRRLLETPQVKHILGEWNLSLENNVIHVNGRCLDGPGLLFTPKEARREIKTEKTRADFSKESGQACYEPIAVQRYIIICTQRDKEKAQRFMDMYKSICGPLGIQQLVDAEIVILKGMNAQDFKNCLTQHADPKKVQFVLVLMPVQKDEVYAAIKRFCVSDKPIPSQCVLTKTLGNEKRLRNIVVKIALQINCKLGGSLWALRMPLPEDVMFVGIDSAHDSLKRDPSVICLVASLNNFCTKYYSRATTSKIHQELVEGLRKMMKDALLCFKHLRGKTPDRVIVFRDGGSLGDLDTIDKTEIHEVKAACDEVCQNSLKKFTFCVVNKRIAQRFFRQDRTTRTYDNPAPGSVIDSAVTYRYFYDFYMVSQLVREGAVNPTHIIVFDFSDEEIHPDLIQKLSYVTTFMYYNWSGTVRVPAMVQYAHKLAALLSKHVKTAPHPSMCNNLYYL